MKRCVLLSWILGLVLLWAVPYCHADLIVEIERRNSVNTPARIAGPLVEDAMSYVDRFHRYKDIPAALVGAEYIQAANDDKWTPFYGLDVTLSRPATLYLFLDHRLGNGATTGMSGQYMYPDTEAAGMYWVEDQGFRDTGWELAIDEWGDGSIDQYFCVFSTDVGPGTVTLYQQCDVTLAGDRNMYVVAVLPEPMTLTLLGLGAALIIRSRR